MSWRYQPVWVRHEFGRTYSLCEVYFENERLTKWTAREAIAPLGETHSQLAGDAARMLVDAWRWKPVAYKSLKVGMTFKPAISPEQAEALAKLVEATSRNLSAAALTAGIDAVLKRSKSHTAHD